MYEKPKCSQFVSGRSCPYEPIRKCSRCGDLICMAHSHEVRSPNSGTDWNAYSGIFCPSCKEIVLSEHDKYAKRLNTKQNVDTAGSMACSCADECCKASGPLVNHICDYPFCR